MITKIKQVIKERWKFYLIGYILGYLIPIINDRQINIYYLFPLKLMGLACALLLGTAFYYGSKQMPVFEGMFRSVKYVLFMIVLFVVILLIKVIISSITGFDITPFIGLPNE
ncbi:hypothetical protein QA584_20260 [Anaerocolumna sp. AGMB13025]|uniref:hypothetical protein n=1 Tax=Anaerocolumna sp. AGMB13025 TaxID=3039116 RepID=UPI00241BEA9F|nr:hypothetical protein [Anaerocolumna sp. AGMB13025]WFR55933.1 hypothetical protein QA584_20260 [Anaerocolumna sp. AGMB13025]